MMDPMITQLANSRHQDMLNEAAEERRARSSAPAQPQSKGFRFHLGSLRISVELGDSRNQVARPSFS